MRILIGGFVLAAALLGCDREDSLAVRTQAVPKQPAPSTVPAVTLTSGMMPPLPGAAADPTAEKAIAFETPPGWQKEPAKSMRIVSFTAGGAPPAGAEMIVSKFPANSGSFLDNINRWRRQVDLQPTDNEANAPSTPVNVSGTLSKRFDIVGKDKRMIVAWAEKDGTWWFFKLVGPTGVMDQQSLNFDQFIQSVKWQ